MTIALELHMSMKQFYEEVDRDELGWWHAYFQVKNELEARRSRTRQNMRAHRGPNKGAPVFDD